jgi:hypothetical protein
MLVLAESVKPVNTEPVQIVVHFDDLLPIGAPLAGNIAPEDPRLTTVVAGVYEFEHLLWEDERAQGEKEPIITTIL